jgi:hypothetical protein
MKQILTDGFTNIDILHERVRNGHYDLLISDVIILPKVWQSTITPGATVKMELWPLDQRRPFGRPPPHGFPPRMQGPLGAGFRPGPPMGFNLPPGWNRPPPGMAPMQTQMPPPPPPGWNARHPRPAPVIVELAKGSAKKSAYSLGSDFTLDDEDDGLGHLELVIDFAQEVEKAELSLGQLLGQWTNAPDAVADLDLDLSDSFSDGSSSDSCEIVD